MTDRNRQEKSIKMQAHNDVLPGSGKSSKTRKKETQTVDEDSAPTQPAASLDPKVDGSRPVSLLWCAQREQSLARSPATGKRVGFA